MNVTIDCIDGNWRRRVLIDVLTTIPIKMNKSEAVF